MIIERVILICAILVGLVVIGLVLVARQRRRWRRAHEALTGVPASPSAWRHYDWRYSSDMVRRRAEELGGKER